MQGGKWSLFGVVKSIFRRLSLKPYGESLLTPGADFWIFGARSIVLLMASAEALSWGYLGSQIGRQFPWLSACIAGVFVFSVIWIIDASFITLDLSYSMYERTVLGKEGASLRRAQLKFAAGALARLLIVFGSLLITAPFLAQLMFSRDIVAGIEAENSKLVASLRAEESKPLLEKIRNLEKEKRELEIQRVQEVSGQGPSKRYGKGPVLLTIENELHKKEDELRAANEVLAGFYREFDSLSRAELQRRYGIDLLEDTVEDRERALSDLLSRPTFSRAELAVQAFLALLFLGLFILKIFQPRSIQLYYNEYLQSLFARYLLGLFDNALEKSEQSTSGGRIDPLRFEEWCLSSFAQVAAEDERRKRDNANEKAHADAIAHWQRIALDVAKEAEPRQKQLASLLEERRLVSTSAGNNRRKLELLQLELQRLDKYLDDCRSFLGEGRLKGDELAEAIGVLRQLEAKRRDLHVAAVTEESSIESQDRHLEALEESIAEARRFVESKRQIISELADRVDDERLKHAKRISPIPPRALGGHENGFEGQSPEVD